jgi:hypothetical protein
LPSGVFFQLRQSPVFVLVVILFFIFRPEEGYIRRLEFIKFLIDNGLFFKNIFSPGIIELLPLIIIVPLIFYRKRVGTAIKGFMDSQMSKAVIEEFDKDGDDKLSKEEFQGFFEKASEDIEEEKKDFDSDALFDKHDSNKDGKLDGDEISSLILELFHVVRNEVTPSSGDEPVKVDSGKDEIQKLDRLYNEGYLSKERYERLKQDLSR